MMRDHVSFENDQEWDELLNKMLIRNEYKFNLIKFTLTKLRRTYVNCLSTTNTMLNTVSNNDMMRCAYHSYE